MSNLVFCVLRQQEKGKIFRDDLSEQIFSMPSEDLVYMNIWTTFMIISMVRFVAMHKILKYWLIFASSQPD